VAFESTAQTTRLLLELSGGQEEAGKALLPLLYDELRTIARRLLADQSKSHTLQPTELVHEAWLRLIDHTQAGPANQVHFLRLAARAMRFVLVDHARAKGAGKRGGGRRPITLDDNVAVDADRAAELLALDEALQNLGRVDRDLERLVELRFFGGLKHEEIAHNLGTSLRTVERDWRLARAWLVKSLEAGHGS
jgi:RNA polymerase sigma factor (TIGR02999 family)